MTSRAQNAADLMALATQERGDFADFLETLTPQQRDAPSLCEAWTVRDVVAHVISYDELGWPGTFKRFAHGRFIPSKINEIGVTIAELLARRATRQCPCGRDAVMTVQAIEFPVRAGVDGSACRFRAERANPASAPREHGQTHHKDPGG